MQIHIGKEIERVYEKSGMRLSEFSSRINTSSRNVYSIFARPEIKTDQLAKISSVLNYNFFALYTPTAKHGNVTEPKEEYPKAKSTISVTLELDGKQSTLEEHIRRITAINRVL